MTPNTGSAADKRTLRYAEQGAVLEVSFPYPAIALERCSGRATMDAGRFLTRALESGLPASGRLTIFGDWESLEGYDLGAKAVVTDWTVRNRKRLAGIHLLVRSPIVAMSVSVSNLITGVETVAYQSRAEFERAYEAACIDAASAADR